MIERRMTREQKRLLRPFAQKLEAMVYSVCTMTPAAQDALLDACQAASTSNCAWSDYAVARVLKSELEWMQRRRPQ